MVPHAERSTTYSFAPLHLTLASHTSCIIQRQVSLSRSSSKVDNTPKLFLLIFIMPVIQLLTHSVVQAKISDVILAFSFHIIVWNWKVLQMYFQNIHQILLLLFTAMPTIAVQTAILVHLDHQHGSWLFLCYSPWNPPLQQPDDLTQVWIQLISSLLSITDGFP